MLGYLESLTLRTAAAVAELPESTRQRHGRFLLEAQQPDGGFRGRQGDSDLYYTGFGLRGLAVLGLLDEQVASKAESFLQGRLAGQETIIDLFSLIYSAKLIEAATARDIFRGHAENWADSVAEILEELRCEDGGYAKGPGGIAGSTYHTFLVILCLQLLQRDVPNPEAAVQFVRTQAAPEGGYREIRVSKRAGTNPTAAAIGILKILDAVDEETRHTTADFLAEMQVDEGGLRANTRIPIADVLSTFTGCLTLLDLQSIDLIDVPAAYRYVESLESSEGGFLGAEWDELCDVEYTFYGLAAMALLRATRR